MRLRLILSFAFITLISIASVVLIARRSTAREIQAFMYRGSMTQLEDLAQELQTYYSQNGSWQGVEAIFPSLGQGVRRGQGLGTGMAAMMNQRLRLADAASRVLADSSGAGIAQPLTAIERRTALPLRVSGSLVGYLLQEGGMTLSGNDGSFLLTRLNRAALFAALIAGGIALLLALLLADRLIHPVRNLIGAVQRMAKGDLSQRVPIHGNDELAELGRNFNHMADSLQQAQENRKAMTADIAHELRTPLAVQRAHLEALQDGIYAPTPENLQPVLEQNLLLTRLVEDLRTLALADSGQLRLERTETNIIGLVQRIADRFSPQATSRGIDLSLEAADALQISPPVLQVDPLRIEQILGNLLSNALRHAPDAGKIEVQIKDAGQAIQILVQDSGPGIPPDALPHIFDRFYRADKSRSRAEGGSGLGLSIARQLAEMHGGNLTATNAPQGGAVFALSLPK